MNNKKIKAFGLVEILVSLVIFGIAVIAVTNLTVSSYRIVKDNELSDMSNSLMLRGMEYFKSAKSITALSAITAGSTVYFKINSGIGTEVGNPAADPSTDNLPVLVAGGAITSCTEGSAYKVYVYNFSAFLLCNQIAVTKTATNDFIIKSTVIYQKSRQMATGELLGYRPRLEE